ncbi:MAG: NAD(P)/FAD-dependent oxidoreductase [Pseudomonadota bacterium]
MVIEVVIIGAGAAGLMCAATAGSRGRRVVVVDHDPRPGRKILAAGGGRCNFTNRTVTHENYLSQNPSFTISALKRFHQGHFLEMVERHGIETEERELGQLFCAGSSREILDMLLAECTWAGVTMKLNTRVEGVRRRTGGNGGFLLGTSGGRLEANSLVIATGGLSLPDMGSTAFGHDLARQFGLDVIEPGPGLVPLTLHPKDLRVVEQLSGIALRAEVTTQGRTFRENLLFTHRGLSGPVVLQASSYWKPGQPIIVNLFPEHDLPALLTDARDRRPKAALATVLAPSLTKRVSHALCQLWGFEDRMGSFGNTALEEIAGHFIRWRLIPSGTEGYRKAEVTLGGIDTAGLSSRTMEARDVPGLYAIGEAVDVTGQLGGYNLQWAWSSGYCAGLFV